MARVDLDHIGKAFGRNEVIPDVNFTIEPGEFTVLVGPSGCGKSTLLRIIAGLETATRGSIRIGGVVVDDMPPKDRDIAMVFQNYALYPQKTVAGNMGFPLRMRGSGKAEVDRKVREVASSLGLEDLLHRYPRQLSGGQRQRVAMGRAIVRNPQVFLFDEPLSNLDAKLRVRMRAEIRELQQRLGATTVYVTHDQIEAMTMADKIVVMQAGVVEQIGDPLDIYDRPVNRFVAGFIGSPAMNFLSGQVEAQEGGIVFATIAGQRINVPDEVSRGLETATSFGIRPEHLDMVTEKTEDNLPMTVSVVEPTGAETMVIARNGADELTATLKGRFSLRPGERIWLKPDASQLHFFDADGQALAKSSTR